MRVSYLTSIKDDAKYELLQWMDKICKEQDITYFAYGDLLVGAAHYHDFIPNDEARSTDIGFLRKDYEKLIRCLRDAVKDTEFIFDEYYADGVSKRPQVRIGKSVLLDTDTLRIQDTFWVDLAAFDAIPQLYDLRIGYFRKVRRLNRKYDYIRQYYNNASSCEGMTARLAGLRRKMKPTDTVYRKLIKAATHYEGQNMEYVGRMVPRRSKMIALDQLFPLQMIPFRDIELPCPKTLDPWTAVMNEELLERVKVIQKLDLVLLKEFDAICRKLNIGYFVCGGTMLGYMRHGGFIPWDDDIDVGMLREDYDRFLKEAGKYLKSPFFLQTRQSDPEIPYLFSKIRLDNTEYITEYNENRNFHKGICLDLFPFDAIPNEEEEEKKFLEQVYEKVANHNKVTNRAMPEPVYETRSRNLEELWYRIAGKLYRRHYHNISFAGTQEQYLKVATRYNANWKELGYTRVASFVPTYTFIEREDLLPYQDVQFEGITVKVPHRPDVFLSMQYGDYMQLPPKHKQAGHDLIRWSADVEGDKKAREEKE